MNIIELCCRFFLLIISILILYFFSNRKDNLTINPLIVIVGLCTFSLSYLFTRLEIGVGIGFGLFAIFSILRFRTQTFTINSIVFLFATITLSILDIMYPLEKIEFLLFFHVIILGFYVFASAIINRKIKNSNTIDLFLELEGEFSFDDLVIKKIIEEKIKIYDFEYKVISINTKTNEVLIKINY